MNKKINYTLENQAHLAYNTLLYTTNWLEDQVKEIFKPMGITSQQFNVSRILRTKHPNSCTASHIKETMMDKSPDLTRLIDRLIDKGMVTREVCAENRRKLDIKITKKGLSMLNVLEPVIREQSRFFEKLSEKELLELNRILEKIRS